MIFATKTQKVNLLDYNPVVFIKVANNKIPALTAEPITPATFCPTLGRAAQFESAR
jgi:hypothetical protein